MINRPDAVEAFQGTADDAGTVVATHAGDRQFDPGVGGGVGHVAVSQPGSLRGRCRYALAPDQGRYHLLTLLAGHALLKLLALLFSEQLLHGVVQADPLGQHLALELGHACMQ